MMNPSSPRNSSFYLFVRPTLGRLLMPLFLSVLAGLLQAASLAWPVPVPGFAQGQPLWWGAWLALAALVMLLNTSPSGREAFLRGWLFATAWLACTFGWLFTAMHTFGGLNAILAVLAVLILAGLLAIYYAMVCMLFWRLAHVHHALFATFFAALWLLAELARGVLLTGFGWGAVGYSQIDGPLAAWIAWVGMYGTSAVVAALAALLATGLSASSLQRMAGCGLAALALMVLPQWLPTPTGGSAGTLTVTLLQGNIAQDEKFDVSTGIQQALHWYGEQLNASRSSLIITPETAFALPPDRLPVGYWTDTKARFATADQAALIGITLGNNTEGYTNSVVGFAPGQARPWRYDKHHLVPFGEFIPTFFRWFTDLMHIPFGDFNRGGLPQPTFDWQGQRLAATICYENLFTEELATQFANEALAPTIWVNVSNLGWFGEHLAMDQHLQIARMRALEFARPFLLATNTGRTAIVNHLGQVSYAAPSHTPFALEGQVEGRTGLTPYARWVAHKGLWPFWVMSLAVLLIVWGCQMRHMSDQSM